MSVQHRFPDWGALIRSQGFSRLRYEGAPSSRRRPDDGVASGREEDGESLTLGKGFSFAYAEEAQELPQPTFRFTAARGMGKWRVLVSNRANGDLRALLRRDPSTFKRVGRTIQSLSRGEFGGDNYIALNHNPTNIPVFQAKIQDALRLIYHVDCVQSEDVTVECQVIRLFGLYDIQARDDHRLWDAVSRYYSGKSKEYRRRCKFRTKADGSGCIHPAIFIGLSTEVATDHAEWNQEEFSSFQPPSDDASSHTLDAEALDKDAELHELLVLEKYTTFSQGLWNGILADEDLAHVFDISPLEREIVEHSGTAYVIGRGGTGKTTATIFKIFLREQAWASMGAGKDWPKPRQVFVTKSPYLVEKVEEYYQKLQRTESISTMEPHDIIQRQLGQRGWISAPVPSKSERTYDAHEARMWSGELPSRFSELKDSHFPLFISYDQLCLLLAADLAENATDSRFDPAQLVTFEVFEMQYWRHFPTNATKGLDPILVFSEILGVIKGSEMALASDQGFLDFETYSRMSRTDTDNAQRQLYSLFELYQARKRLHGRIDTADRTRILIRELDFSSLPYLDFIYVDEAQDNLLIDALVLRLLCRRYDGMTWVGDTAQTISPGSAFRFQELTALIYRLEEAYKSFPDYPWSVPRPKLFQLTKNYRAHGGITDCAHAIVEIIYNFWPDLIDKLEREQALLPGLRPKFFTGWPAGTFDLKRAMTQTSDEVVDDEIVDFGAKQYILVRDEKARQDFYEQYGVAGLVMTIYEAKGLESNDVLLWNFFEDSPVDYGRWRVLLNLVPNNQRLTHTVPLFDESHHASLCFELKSLYVAITRARHNLWIFDNSERADPFRQYLKSRNLVTEVCPGMAIPRLSRKSEATEWAETGRLMFKNKRYEQAIYCFKKAGLAETEGAIAESYRLREVARNLSLEQTANTQQAFITAAKSFKKCAEKSAWDRSTFLRSAAECFAEAREFRSAADCLIGTKDYDRAARQLHKGKHYEELAKLISEHRSLLSQPEYEDVIRDARLHYLKSRDSKEQQRADSLFDSDEEKLQFFSEYGMDQQRIELLEKMGRYIEAVNEYLAQNQIRKAVMVLLREKRLTQAKSLVLERLWRHLPLGSPPKRGNMEIAVRTLIEVANTVLINYLSIEEAAEIQMFSLLQDGDYKTTVEVGRRFLQSDNLSAALLCLHPTFVHPPSTPLDEPSASWDLVNLSVSYIRTLDGFRHVLTDDERSERLKVCGIYLESGFYWFPSSSLIGQHVLRDKELQRLVTIQEKNMVVKPHYVQHIVSAFFDILTQNQMTLYEDVFSRQLQHICYPFATLGHCPETACRRIHEYDSVDLARNNVCAHLFRVVISQMRSDAFPMLVTIYHQQHGWVDRLHDSLLMFQEHSHETGGDTLNMFDSGTVAAIQNWLKSRLIDLDVTKTQIEPKPLHLQFQAHIVCGLVEGLLDIDKNDYRIGQVSIHRDVLPTLTRKSLAYRMIKTCEYAYSSDLDLNVLCDQIDSIFSRLAALWHTRNGRLHNITLPRRLLWHIATISLELGPIAVMDSLIWVLLGRISSILNDVLKAKSSGEYHLRSRGTILARVAQSELHQFVRRLCVALWMLGRNSISDQLKTSVIGLIRTVEVKDRHFPRCFAQLPSIADWNHFSRFILENMSRSADFVRLCDGFVPFQPNYGNKAIKHVTYKDVTEIPQALGYHQGPHRQLIQHLPHLTSSPDIKSSSGSSKGEMADNPEKNAPDPVGYSDQHSGNVTGDRGGISGQGEGHLWEQPSEVALEDDQVEDALSEHSDELAEENEQVEEEGQDEAPIEAFENAIIKMQQRRRLLLGKRKDALTPSPLEPYFLQCLELVDHLLKGKEDVPRQFQMMLRGPLPHALLAAESIHPIVAKMKDEAKRVYAKARGLALEEADVQLDRATKWVKRISGLQRTVKPTKTNRMYITRDTDKLKKQVREIHKLAAELCDLFPQEQNRIILEHTSLAFRGIIGKSKPSQDEL